MERLLEALELSPYVISVVHEKGGVGKTTLSENLADAFTRMGFRVLLVDSDPSKALTKWDAIKSSVDFTVTELTTKALFKNLNNYKRGFHIVIIDGAPGVNELTASLINAANLALIPITPSIYDVWMTRDLLDFLKTRQIISDGKLNCAFVFNRVVKNAHFSKEIQDEMKNFDFPCLESVLNNYIVYAVKAKLGLTVLHGTKNKAQIEVNSLANELFDKYISKVEKEELVL